MVFVEAQIDEQMLLIKKGAKRKKVTMLNFDKLKETIRDTKILRFKGYVTEIVGLTIYAQGPKASVGELVYIQSKKILSPQKYKDLKKIRPC